MSAVPDLDALQGVWRRTLLVDVDGARDTESAVYWLQLGALSGDIRAPGPGRPAESAFAGTLAVTDGVARWTHELSRGISAGTGPDEGRLTWQDGLLREEGVHAPYLELWECVAHAGPDAWARRIGEAGRQGIALEIGPFAFVARGNGTGAAAFTLLSAVGTAWRVALSLGEGEPIGAEIPWPPPDAPLRCRDAGPG